MSEFEKTRRFGAAEAAIDAALESLPSFRGAVELSLAPVLPLASPLAAEYCEHFPHLACRTSFGGSERAAQDGEFLLSSTCCYPIFWSLRRCELPARTCVTLKNWCFRNESRVERWRRERVFRMREFVFFGTADEVDRWTDVVVGDFRSLLERMKLKPSVEFATDHFFNPQSLKRKIQLDQRLKREIVTDGLALGSVNLHLNAICKKVRIRCEKSVAFSACFGIGYQRLWHTLSERDCTEGALHTLESAGRA